MQKLTLFLVVCALAGCASEGEEWVRDETQTSQAEQDLAQCKYEAEQATATVGTDDEYKTTGDAIGAGVASGVEKGLEQHDLVEKCMKAKGYTR